MTYRQWRPHPWHGLELGDLESGIVNAFIEITPFDLVKYEVDKESGYLRVDRPSRTSSLPPTLYGFVPRTYCGESVKALMTGAAAGDADPLDICVISDRLVNRAEVIIPARVVGGIPMLDGGEADDKIIGVHASDEIWSSIIDIDDLPAPYVARLRHYFASYKTLPEELSTVDVGQPYGREHALRVLRAAVSDYQAEFP
ncbi:MAG: inorganic pyrophosphatase [Pseudomonadales bacterium]|nr:inorganic pyrophosphatase [Pseudomonadales bacterium]NIX07510.1 inorganic pyrophosphatase [Pseudomonadales bacterium]